MGFSLYDDARVGVMFYRKFLTFSLFKIRKTYQNVMKMGLIIVSVVNVNIMIFFLELTKWRRSPVVIWLQFASAKSLKIFTIHVHVCEI